MNKLPVYPNNNLSHFQSENAKLSIGRVDEGPYMYLINERTTSLLMLRMNEKDKSIAVNAQVNGAWGSEKLLATKDDLGVFLTNSGTKAAAYKANTEIVTLKLYAGHTYLVLGKSESSATVSTISARIVGPSSDYGTIFNLGDARTSGASGGGCMTGAIVTLTKDFTISLIGYGYDDVTYNYKGSLFAVQLK